MMFETTTKGYDFQQNAKPAQNHQIVVEVNSCIHHYNSVTRRFTCCLLGGSL